MNPALRGLLLAAVLLAGGACETMPEAEEPAEATAEELTEEPAGAAADGEAGVPPDGEAGAGVRGLPYELEFTGVEETGLLAILEATSRLKELQDRPPATPARLDLRVDEDLRRLGAAMRSEGYYDAELSSRVATERSPAMVTIEIELGPRYRLHGYDVLYEGRTPPPEELRPGLAELGLELDSPARGPTVAAAERRWPTLMKERGYPLARVIDRKAVINRETKDMAVTLRVDAGRTATFGEARVSGLEAVAETHVRSLLPWRAGEDYDSRKLEEARRVLSDSRLFSSVAVRPGAEVGPDGELPVDIQLAERPPRTIGFGASYSTDIGFGVDAFWEHRNFFGNGERLRVDLKAAQIEQSAGVGLRKPSFRRRDQVLLFNLALGNELTDAYDERSLTSFAGLESGLADNWRLTGGIAPEYRDLEEDGLTERFFLIGLPLVAIRDLRDNLLDPTKGTRLSLSLTPYYGTVEETVFWLTGSAGAAAYFALDSDRRFVLAGRGRLGFLVGEENEDVPASKRFYAGGGGSIRGYEFQSVGPLEADNDPVGGRSLLEFSAELRARITKDIGLVPFIDGGTVFTSVFPDFSETTRWAAGLGLRYFTGFGPFRVDFAFPLNGRDSDDAFQFYVSLGQAF